MKDFLKSGFFTYPPFSFLFFIFLLLLNQNSYYMTFIVYAILTTVFLSFKWLFSFIARFKLSTQASSILILYLATIVMTICYLIFRLVLIDYNYLYSYIIMMSLAFMVLLAYIEANIFESSLTSSIQNILLLPVVILIFMMLIYVSNLLITLMFGELETFGLVNNSNNTNKLYWLGFVKNSIIFSFLMALAKKINRGLI